MPLSTENSVKAKVYGAVPQEEAEALEAMDPGQGVVRGNGGVSLTGADTTTRRVVREQRNPGSQGIEDNVSPLEKGYAANENVETIIFRSGDYARLRVEADASADETISDGDDLGWNTNGYLSPNATETIAEAANEDNITITDGTNEFVLVQFR